MSHDALSLADEAMEKAGKATQGPFRLRRNVVEPDHHNHAFTGAPFSKDEDAEYVVWCYNNVPALASAIREQAEENEETTDTVVKMVSREQTLRDEVERLRGVIESAYASMRSSNGAQAEVTLRKALPTSKEE